MLRVFVYSRAFLINTLNIGRVLAISFDLEQRSLEFKTETVLRQKLKLSRSEFDKLLAGGNLLCTSSHNLKKCKVSRDVAVELRY